jgi:hypothetical protein
MNSFIKVLLLFFKETHSFCASRSFEFSYAFWLFVDKDNERRGVKLVKKKEAPKPHSFWLLKSPKEPRQFMRRLFEQIPSVCSSNILT